MRSGGVERQYAEGTPGMFAAGDVLMYAPHDRPYTGVIKSARYDLLMFDPDLLDEVAATAPGRRTEPVRLTDDRPIPVAAQRLRALITHLRGHVLTDPVSRESPLTISAAAGITGRAVQAAFRRHRDTTPMAYLRRVRLNRAHHDLTAADPNSGVTVGQIAARSGFSSPAIFTDLYRRQYGITPRRTLDT